jgi:hypothetical protein
VLAVSSLALLVAPFFFLPLGSAFRVILFGFAVGAGIVVLLTAATKNPMLQYYVGAMLTVAAIVLAV